MTQGPLSPNTILLTSRLRILSGQAPSNDPETVPLNFRPLGTFSSVCRRRRRALFWTKHNLEQFTPSRLPLALPGERPIHPEHALHVRFPRFQLSEMSRTTPKRGCCGWSATSSTHNDCLFQRKKEKKRKKKRKKKVHIGQFLIETDSFHLQSSNVNSPFWSGADFLFWVPPRCPFV